MRAPQAEVIVLGLRKKANTEVLAELEKRRQRGCAGKCARSYLACRSPPHLLQAQDR